MTGLRCPNCGFYNLSVRAKCARCGKPLPELTAEQKEIPFDEASESGEVSIISPSEEAKKVETSDKKVQEVKGSDEEGASVRWEIPKPEASSLLRDEKFPSRKPLESTESGVKTKPSLEPEIMVQVEESRDTQSGSILEAEIISSSQELSPADTASKEDKISLEKISEQGIESRVGSVLTGEVILDRTQDSGTSSREKSSEPELPSFDESVATKVEISAELGELSSFFQGIKKKPEVQESEAGDDMSQVRLKEEAGTEESLSQIGIVKEETSGPSFKPDFDKPLFSQFGEESEEKQAIESSESAVSAPSVPGRTRFLLGGVIDLLVYLLIGFLFILAGEWASGSRFWVLRSSEGFWSIIGLILLALLSVIWFYQVFFLSVLGQTLGGLVFRLEVLDFSGNRPRVLRAALRALVYLLCLVPLGLGFVPAILGNSLPDKIARTRLVRW